MSQQTLNENATSNPIYARLTALTNEEKVIKDLASIQLNRFKSYDELTEEIFASDQKEEFVAILNENLQEQPRSFLSRYILGLLDLKAESHDGLAPLRELLDEFKKGAKWTIVDHIADQILNIEGHNRQALRAKVESTERLRGRKELRPYLERLADIDQQNPEVAKKFGQLILEEDPEQALRHFKRAADLFARIKDYHNLQDSWNQIVRLDHQDLPFFEKIERVLVGNHERVYLAGLLFNLVEPCKADENWNNVIHILKKILTYDPTSGRARSELVRTYRTRYENHSLLNDFLKMSELTNNKKLVGPCILNFERNIVFDKDNYVFHRSRGVGLIISIDSDEVIIDFKDNPGQKLSIQMAISSLQPLEPSHIWVRHYENQQEIEELFSKSLTDFFELMLQSFGKKMTLAEIKTEVTARYLPLEQWSKWWSKARSELKKSEKFGFNPRKKDELLLRETPMSSHEELSINFQNNTDWDKKLDLALEAVKAAQELKDDNSDLDRSSDLAALQTCIKYYSENESNKDQLKRIHSFLFLNFVREVLEDDSIQRKQKRTEIEEHFASLDKESLVQYCLSTQPTEFKRDLIELIIKTRPDDYPEILGRLLIDDSSKISRYLINELNRLGQRDTLQKFLSLITRRYRDYPEIFLWSARNILRGEWNYDWIELDREELLLLVLRLLKPLGSIEKKGTRLKNSAIDTLFGTTNLTVDSISKYELITEVVKAAEVSTLRRMSALFKDVPWVPDAHKENFLAFIEKLRPDYLQQMEQEHEEAEREPGRVSLFPAANTLLTTAEGLTKRKAYLDNLVNVEMPANSRDIGEAQEKGDLRENAEYKAAMERQTQLQAEITRINNELKQVEVLTSERLHSDMVTIGARVELEEVGSGEKLHYSILGPWEADPDNFIISYESPLGKALIGKHVGEEASLDSGRKLIVLAISSAI